MTVSADFQEIGHSGGRVTIRIGPFAQGERGYQLTWSHQRPVPSAIFGVYAIPQGVAVGRLDIRGIGQPFNPPPIPGCYQVFIGSDSEGKFGYQCPECNSYWRGGGGVCCCPYCGIRAGVQDFLTPAQRSYVSQYCALMREALSTESDGEYVIDLDEVADAVGKCSEKPPFYYAEISQQNKFICEACGSYNDILGRFGYCSHCGTRNDLQELRERTIRTIRDRVNSGGPFEACVKDAVAAFDSLVGQYVEQLLRWVPLTASRKKKFENRRFHNLELVAAELRRL
jgi:hypothetical protein